MKKLFVIGLIIQITTIQLFEGGVAGELFKFFNLVEHFQHHQASSGNIGFFEFLAMHYSSESAHASEHESDPKLPFSHLSGATHIVAIPTESLNYKGDLYLNANKDFIIHDDRGFIETFNGEIWLPPKLG